MKDRMVCTASMLALCILMAPLAMGKSISSGPITSMSIGQPELCTPLRQQASKYLPCAGATAPTSLALTLRANILTQQSATALSKGVSASDPNIHVPGTEAYQKYQAAIQTAKVVSSQIANQRDLAAVTVSYAAQSICSGTSYTPTLLQCKTYTPRVDLTGQHQNFLC